jgi:hypothetical protein
MQMHGDNDALTQKKDHIQHVPCWFWMKSLAHFYPTKHQQQCPTLVTVKNCWRLQYNPSFKMITVEKKDDNSREKKNLPATAASLSTKRPPFRDPPVTCKRAPTKT